MRQGLTFLKIKPYQLFAAKWGIWFEAKDFDITKFVDAREGKRMDRFCQLAVASAVQAVKDSGLDFSKENLDRCGVLVGSGIGGIQEIEQQKVLKKVVWQERMLLAACVLLPIAGVILMLMFPNILLVPTQLYRTIYLLAKETAANMARQWQLWMGYAAVAVVMIYAVYEVLLADN